MDKITVEKKTVDEAVEEALSILKISRDEAEISVEEEPAKGLFGFIGSKNARVTVTKKSVIEAKKNIEVVNEEPKTECCCHECEAEAEETCDDLSCETDGDEPVEEGNGHKKSFRTKLFDNVEIYTTDEAAIDGAREFLDGMVRCMGYAAEVKIIDNRADGDNVVLDIVPEDYKKNSRFIGKKGDTLSAIGYMVNNFLKYRYEGELMIEVDCGDYIYDKKEDLKKFAMTAAERAKAEGVYRLRPMSAYDRRIVHKALSEVPGISTHSEGEEPRRRIVVTRDPQ